MKRETRTERLDPVVMRDAQGVEYRVFAEKTFSRDQYMDGSWSKWQEMSMRLFTTDSPVNPPEKGWYEHVATGTRIRP